MGAVARLALSLETLLTDLKPVKESKENAAPWWGPVVVPHGHAGRWQIGPLTLWVERLQGEWRIARSSSDDAGSARVEHEIGPAKDDLLSHESLSRFGLSGQNESIALVPALADRPVVSTPRRPFYIPAGEEVTIYVGTPLWIRLFVGETQLDEFAIHQPPDTWFGPSPQMGEVCYASRSFCRLQLEAVLTTPHRATTSVLIQNHASTSLYLDQVKLPVPYLSLYSDPDTADLWTNDVVLQRVEDQELAPLQVRDGAPASLLRAREVCAPRRQASGNVMIRAFETLFSDRLGGA